MKTDTAEYARIEELVRSWPAGLRLSLAEGILASLRAELQLPRGVPADRVRSLAAGEGSPPDDLKVKEWLAQHRAEKYG